MPDKHFFFVNPESVNDRLFSLDPQESHHAINVLRLQIDSEMWLTNGQGVVYKSLLKSINEQTVSGSILESYSQYGENRIYIHLGIGVLKNESMKLAVEKATECGVDAISPIIFERCIARKIKLDKYKSIAKSAVKQCGRSIIPEIHSISTLEEWIHSIQGGEKLVCSKTGTVSLMDTCNPKQEKIFLLIGPEGDLTPGELKILKTDSFKFVSLGSRRLRSETAVTASVSIINSLYR